jgi:tetratricopeptide (TPR) repeat protein
MKLLNGAAVAAALLAGAIAASAQTDTIKLVNGTIVKGKVIRAGAQTVTYTDATNKTQTLKTSDIGEDGIVFGDEPPSLPRAKVASGEGKAEKALTLFQAALQEIETKKLREINKAPLFYQWSIFLRDRGDVEGALAMFSRLRKECGDCHLRPHSYWKSIELARRKGVEAHKAILQEMKAEPEPLAGEAEMALADLAFTGGTYEEALPIYTRLSGNSGASYVAEAKLGVFRCLKALRKTADLETFAKRVLDDRTAPPSLQQAAGAWAAALLLEKAAKEKPRVRDAILAAAKAIAIGPPEKREDAEDYVSALRVAAKGYALLAVDAPKPEQKQEYKSRASGYLTEIIRVYKGTPWAESAEQEKQALGLQNE